ncbi:protein of unknown function (plasmid) [Methylocella tundrae]|uniref:Uncharacterized protein n=1 Tax=Methylocella tundrae TaxID=227605 RepID=A0A4U8Z6Y2_METTU|nr:protein of unknown function [Methylocella tundrae]
MPLGLDEKRPRAFCRTCAKLRNDISHFSGERHDASYSEFLNNAKIKSEALTIHTFTEILSAHQMACPSLKNHTRKLAPAAISSTS